VAGLDGLDPALFRDRHAEVGQRPARACLGRAGQFVPDRA
jgi:hypothetical protein